MLPMKPLHEGAEYAVCPVVGVVRLAFRTVDDILGAYFLATYLDRPWRLC